MIEPTFDRDGYPTEETEERIKTWPIKFFSDCEELLDFVGRAWSYPDYWYKSKQRTKQFGQYRRLYRVSTGGWSGNESLISSLQENYLFWGLSWVQSKRGGHYIFEVRYE